MPFPSDLEEYVRRKREGEEDPALADEFSIMESAPSPPDAEPDTEPDISGVPEALPSLPSQPAPAAPAADLGAEYRTASEADAKSAGRATLANLLSRSVDMMRGRPTAPLNLQNKNSEVANFLLRQKLKGGGAKPMSPLQNAQMLKILAEKALLDPASPNSRAQLKAMGLPDAAIAGVSEGKAQDLLKNWSERQAGAKPFNAPTEEWIKRGAALKRPITPVPGLDAETHQARVLAAEREQDAESLAEEKRKNDKSDATKSASEKLEASLRNEFQGKQVYKDTELLAGSVLKMASARPTAAGDMSAIYSYMRLLDPGSAVKEAEYASAKNAAGWPQRMRVAYNNALAGEILDPETRRDFLDQANLLWKAQQQRFDVAASEHGRLARESGVRPDNVVLDMGFGAINRLLESKIGGSKTSTPATPVVPLPRPKTYADAEKLPEGTRFIDPDGVVRVR
jgi:hypothetical protein